MAFTTYSFKDISAVFSHPLSGTLNIGSIQGADGIGQITIHVNNENTIHDISVDGGIIIWPVAVFSGVVSIQCQQTSTVHAYFTNWFNQIKIGLMDQNAPDASTFASGAMFIRNINNGATHSITGISPQMQPDKTYSAQGGMVTWNLMAGNINNQ